MNPQQLDTAMIALRNSLAAAEAAQRALEQVVELGAYVRNALAVQSASIGQVLAHSRGEDPAAYFEAQRAKFRATCPNLYVADMWGAVPDWLTAARPTSPTQGRGDSSQQAETMPG